MNALSFFFQNVYMHINIFFYYRNITQSKKLNTEMWISFCVSKQIKYELNSRWNWIYDHFRKEETAKYTFNCECIYHLNWWYIYIQYIVQFTTVWMPRRFFRYSRFEIRESNRNMRSEFDWPNFIFREH